MKLLKHPFILKERSVKPKKVLEVLVKDAEQVIKEIGSREIALGIQDDEKGSGDSDSVEKASGSSTSTSGGGSLQGSMVIRKPPAKDKEPKNAQKDQDKDDDGAGGPVSTTDFSTMKVRGKVVNQNAEFVPQFADLLQKSDSESKVKYEAMDIKELSEVLSHLDKKLLSDIDDLKLFYDQDSAIVQKILSTERM